MVIVIKLGLIENVYTTSHYQLLRKSILCIEFATIFGPNCQISLYRPHQYFCPLSKSAKFVQYQKFQKIKIKQAVWKYKIFGFEKVCFWSKLSNLLVGLTNCPLETHIKIFPICPISKVSELWPLSFWSKLSNVLVGLQRFYCRL